MGIITLKDVFEDLVQLDLDDGDKHNNVIYSVIFLLILLLIMLSYFLFLKTTSRAVLIFEFLNLIILFLERRSDESNLSVYLER